MDSFELNMPQEYATKSEVSGAILRECDDVEQERFKEPAFEKEGPETAGPRDDLAASEAPLLKRRAASSDALPSDEQASSLSVDSDSADPSLPPRKRAKTQEEKEQRRVERIMRNRQAAHASREKKRKHLEYLELRCAELETENDKLKAAHAGGDMLRLRVQQLECAMLEAQRSGDLKVLAEALQQSPVPTQMFEDAAPLPADSVHVQTLSPGRHAGSPVPSLVDDCASPDALVIKTEEPDDFSPLSAEKFPVDADFDLYSIPNFSFDSNPPASAGTLSFSASSSKSRHPADLTPLPADFFLA